MDTRGPPIPASNGNRCNHVNVGLFITYIVSVPNPENTAHYAANSKIHQKISRFGPLKNLIRARGIENFRTKNINCSTLIKIQPSPEISLWTK